MAPSPTLLTRRAQKRRRSVGKVEAIVQRFAGLEVRHDLARHGHLAAGAWVVPEPRTTRADGEHAKAA